MLMNNDTVESKSLSMNNNSINKKSNHDNDNNNEKGKLIKKLTPCSSIRYKKPTPCSALNDLRKEIIRRNWFGGGNNKSIALSIDTAAGSELLQLCYNRTDHKNTADIVYNKIVILLNNKKLNGIIHYIDSDNGNYNALHYVCSNPSLTNHLKLIQLLVNASEIEQGKMKEHQIKQLQQNGVVDNNNDDTMSVSSSTNSNYSSLAPSTDKLVRQPTAGHGKLPLHLLCQNATTSNLDVFDYMIRCDPASVCSPDYVEDNLPLHYLCITCTEGEVPIEIVILLVQQWPESCRIKNKEGDLPLHLAARIISNQPNIQYQNFQQIDDLEDLNLNDNDDKDDDDDDEDFYNYYSGEEDDERSCVKSVRTTTRSSINSKHTKAVRHHSTDGVIPLSTESYHTIQKERKVYEILDQSRYEKQLDIVQYLVEVYPDAMSIKNNDGLTPLQIAISTSPKGQQDFHSSFSSIHSGHSCSHPIIDFLRDAKCGDEGSSSSNASFAGDTDDNDSDDNIDYNNNKKVAKKEQQQNLRQQQLLQRQKSVKYNQALGIHDVSGREADDDDDICPWKMSTSPISKTKKSISSSSEHKQIKQVSRVNPAPTNNNTNRNSKNNSKEQNKATTPERRVRKTISFPIGATLVNENVSPKKKMIKKKKMPTSSTSTKQVVDPVSKSKSQQEKEKKKSRRQHQQIKTKKNGVASPHRNDYNDDYSSQSGDKSVNTVKSNIWEF